MLMALVLPALTMATISTALVGLQNRRELIEERANQVWEQLALDFDLTFTHGYLLEDRTVEREVVGSVGDLSVHVEALSDVPGHGRMTRAWVSLGDCGLPDMELHANQPLLIQPRNPDMHRIITGDADFDRRFELRAKDDIAACQALTARARLDLLKLGQLAPTLRLHDNVLEWTEDGEVNDLERLEHILAGIRDTAMALRDGAHNPLWAQENDEDDPWT